MQTFYLSGQLQNAGPNRELVQRVLGKHELLTTQV